MLITLIDHPKGGRRVYSIGGLTCDRCWSRVGIHEEDDEHDGGRPSTGAAAAAGILLMT